MDQQRDYNVPGADPAPELIRAYQRRLRHLRNLMLVETLVLVPLVLILGGLLISTHMERGRVATIRFGTVLELAVRDEATANRVIEGLKRDASGGRLPTSKVTISPQPSVAVGPKGDRTVVTEIEAIQQVRALDGKGISILTDAMVISVDGEPIAAAATEDDARFAMDALVEKYGKTENIISAPKIISQVSMKPEQRPPSRLKFSRDELLNLFDEEKTPDVCDYSGPSLSLDAVLKKRGLTREQLALMNRNVDFTQPLADGTKLRVKPGRDRLEVEYEVTESATRKVPPPVKEIPDATLEKGRRVDVTPGKPGEERVVYRLTLRNDREVRCVVASREVTQKAEEKTVKVGTKGGETSAAH